MDNNWNIWPSWGEEEEFRRRLLGSNCVWRTGWGVGRIVSRGADCWWLRLVLRVLLRSWQEKGQPLNSNISSVRGFFTLYSATFSLFHNPKSGSALGQDLGHRSVEDPTVAQVCSPHEKLGCSWRWQEDWQNRNSNQSFQVSFSKSSPGHYHRAKPLRKKTSKLTLM